MNEIDKKELRGQPLDKIQEGYFCYDKEIRYNTLSDYAKQVRKEVRKEEKNVKS